MKKIQYNSFDVILRQLALFFTSLLIILMCSTYLVANEIGYKEVYTKGRAVIMNNDLDLAKKRALEDALYLASLQGGARIDGYSNIDASTSLNENILVRPSSTIKDFVILEENQDETHYNISIKAYLVNTNNMLNCANRDFVNLSYLEPHYTISSRLPPWTSKLPHVISSEIFKNLNNINFINLKDSSKVSFNPSKVVKKSISLDYNNLVEGTRNALNDGEFAVHPIIILDSAKGRLTKVSKELSVYITLNIYEGPDYKVLDSLDYKFSLWIGNKTGYSHIDAYLRVSEDKLTEFVNTSISKIQYRILDKLKCQPLRAKIEMVNNELVIPIGLNQGLKRGTVGFISDSEDINMSEWIVLTVRDSKGNSATIEPLNPLNKKEDIKGKVIKFMN